MSYANAMQSIVLRDCYWAGYTAAQRGEPKDPNPFASTADWSMQSAWLDGWYDQKQVAKAE